MNDALREHVTNIGFALTLSKRQIDLLVMLHHFKSINGIHQADITPGWYVPTFRALEHRGLVYLLIDPEQKKLHGVKDHKLTKAGHLVVALLKEAGIYQERMTDLGIINKRAA